MGLEAREEELEEREVNTARELNESMSEISKITIRGGESQCNSARPTPALYFPALNSCMLRSAVEEEAASVRTMRDEAERTMVEAQTGLADVKREKAQRKEWQEALVSARLGRHTSVAVRRCANKGMQAGRQEQLERWQAATHERERALEARQTELQERERAVAQEERNLAPSRFNMCPSRNSDMTEVYHTIRKYRC